MSPLCRMGEYNSSLMTYMETTLGIWRTSNEWWDVDNTATDWSDGNKIFANAGQLLVVSEPDGESGSVRIDPGSDYPAGSPGGGANDFYTEYPHAILRVTIGGRPYEFGLQNPTGNDDFRWSEVQPPTWTVAAIEENGTEGWDGDTTIVMELYSSGDIDLGNLSD